MTKLSPSHLTILVSACDRGDGIAVRPSDLKQSAAIKAAAKLVELALVREIRTKGDMPTWCQNEQGHSTSLKILKAGREAVQASVPQKIEGQAPAAGTDGMQDDQTSKGAEQLPPNAAAAKAGAKRALILSLLYREEGATIEALMAATGWLPHTTRAALSGLRKSGLTIARSRDGDGSASVYRIDPTLLDAAA